MADNQEVYPGSDGTPFTVAADEIAGAKHQRVKIQYGVDGSATDVSDTNPLPIDDAGGSITVDGTVTADLGATDNAVLDAIAASVGTLDNAISGSEMQVDVVAALPAGTNAIGKLAANSGVDIGDVDVTSVPADPFGANADAAATAGSTGSIQAKLRLMTSQLDSIKTAVETLDNTVGGSELQVDVVSAPTLTVNSHAVTNAGTFAVQESGSALTALQLIDDSITTTGSAVTAKGILATGTDGTNARALKTDSSGELQVDVLTVPTITVNSHAVTNAGTFAVQVDGNALTALQLIDNTIVADDAAFTPGTTSVNMAGFEADESSTDSVDEGDAGAARMTLDRKLIVTPQPHTAGGLSIFRSLDLDESEEDVKTSAGCVYGMWVTNTATSTRFVKFYNATAANVTVGTTTPVITIGIPGNSSDDVSGNFGPGGIGITFDTAISVAATTGVTDADTGAPGANEVIVNIFYK